MGNLDYQGTQEDAAAQAKSVARDQHNAAVWAMVLDKFHIADCDANYGLVLEWCGGQVLQFAAIDDLLRSKRTDITLVMTTRDELATQIVDQMKHRSEWDKKQFRLRLGTYSLKQLRDLLRKFRAQAEITTKAQAVAVLKATGPKPPRFPGYAQLLPMTFLRDVFRYVDTSQYLHELTQKAQFAKGTEGAMAVYELKKYCRLYGTDQVNWYANAGREKAEAEALSND